MSTNPSSPHLVTAVGCHTSLLPSPMSISLKNLLLRNCHKQEKNEVCPRAWPIQVCYASAHCNHRTSCWSGFIVCKLGASSLCLGGPVLGETLSPFLSLDKWLGSKVNLFFSNLLWTLPICLAEIIMESIFAEQSEQLIATVFNIYFILLLP